MKIRYKKKRAVLKLIIGIAWLAIGLLGIVKDNPTNWFYWFYLVIGVAWLGILLYETGHQYLTIKDGFIHKSSLSSKKINLSEIKRIKKFGGTYTLKTENTELVINTSYIDEKSLAELNLVLGRLNAEQE